MLRGSQAVLARHTRVLPQPDQLCGPFSAAVALAGVVPGPAGVVDLARTAGTQLHDEAVGTSHPPGSTLLTSQVEGWDDLPRTEDPEEAGTDATGLVGGLVALHPEIAVVPAAGAGDVVGLLAALADGGHRVAVLANLRTGPVAPSGVTWDVGHFVVLWGVDADDGPAGTVAVADTYVELGADGWPRGCRPVDGTALSGALADRGLLLLTPAGGPSYRSLVGPGGLVAAHGFGDTLWST